MSSKRQTHDGMTARGVVWLRCERTRFCEVARGGTSSQEQSRRRRGRGVVGTLI